MRFLFISIVLILVSCRSSGDRDKTLQTDEMHIHSDNEWPTMDTTIWTETIELFVEFPALVVDSISRFAAHCTVLEKHQPVHDGSVTMSLIKGDKGIRQTVDAPSSPGIFTPSLQPVEEGICQLVFDLKTPAFSDRIVIDNIRVFASMDEAKIAIGEEEGDDGTITFLKEQAWKMEFQTNRVIEDEIYDIITTSGVWRVPPSDIKTMVATTSGTVTFKSANLTVGGQVKRGQLVMTISSSELTSDNLDAEIQKARAQLEQIQSEYDRKKQLYALKIVPKSEFEVVEQNYQIIKATYETLNRGYASGGKNIIVPYDGYIKEVLVSNGTFVIQGAGLITISSHKSILLETQASPSYASQLTNIYDVWYQPKPGMWSSLTRTGGSVLSVSKEVEQAKPMLSVFARVNDEVEMPEGSFTEVQIAFGDRVSVPVIPESALLEEYGKYSVIVQLSGESFEKRTVAIGRRNGNDVEVKDGVEPGEVIVTKGAYQVKMASMSRQAPAHGHTH